MTVMGSRYTGALCGELAGVLQRCRYPLHELQSEGQYHHGSNGVRAITDSQVHLDEISP